MTTQVASTVHNASDNAAAAAVAAVARDATGIVDLFCRLDALEYYTERKREFVVSECRAAGLSWDQIGHARGVSGQAMRQRYGPRNPRLRATPPDEQEGTTRT